MYIKTFKKFKLFESLEDFNTVSLEGYYYHGTSIEDKLFKPEIGYSDYDAIWVTDELMVAQDFSDYHYWGGEDYKQVVLKTYFKSDNIIEIPYGTYKDLLEYYGVEDLRDTIEYLNHDYDGWVTKGSLDKMLYNDIAVFDDDLLDFTEVSYFKNNEWSKFEKIKW